MSLVKVCLKTQSMIRGQSMLTWKYVSLCIDPKVCHQQNIVPFNVHFFSTCNFHVSTCNFFFNVQFLLVSTCKFFQRAIFCSTCIFFFNVQIIFSTCILSTHSTCTFLRKCMLKKSARWNSSLLTLHIEKKCMLNHLKY